MRASPMVWAGRALTAAFVLFIIGASAVPKLMGLPVAEATLADLGWPPGHAFGIGLVELTCLLLYLIPRTRLLGAVLFTGLFGGAMATQLRAETPLFSHALFSVYLGVVMWGGLWLRDARLRAVFPFMTGSAPAALR